MTPFIIAEMGSTHDGDLGRALRVLGQCAHAGASAFKGQFWSSTAGVVERMHGDAAMARTLERLRMPAGWLPRLSMAAHARGLEFICTVDLEEDIAVVAPHVDRFKIASWGATDAAFLAAHRRYDKPCILSTGVCTTEELRAVLATRDMRDWYLHCVSAYPAPVPEMNLALIRRWSLDGLSDHSARIMMGALAVAAGARVLEVHVRAEDTHPENPDARVSLSPAEFAEYARCALLAAEAMGDGIKRVMPSEEINRRHRYV